MKGTTSFPIDNCNKREKNHFLVFVCFLNKINDFNILPEVYIVPSIDLNKNFKELENKSLVYKNPKGNRQVIQLCKLKKVKDRYLNKWKFFE